MCVTQNITQMWGLSAMVSSVGKAREPLPWAEALDGDETCGVVKATPVDPTLEPQPDSVITIRLLISG